MRMRMRMRRSVRIEGSGVQVRKWVLYEGMGRVCLVLRLLGVGWLVGCCGQSWWCSRRRYGI